MSSPSQLALVTLASGDLELKRVPVPQPSTNEVLVKVVAVAQNPVDWKKARLRTVPHSIAGCDFSGIVVQLGLSVSTRHIGERVAGFVAGGVHRENGAFAEYVVAEADVCISIPDTWSFETAAQLPISAFTACQIFDQSLGLPMLQYNADAKPILIYAASSAVGMCAVQFAKLSGHNVYATCSPRNFDLVKGFGADKVFDYRDPLVSQKIHEASSGNITLAIDCISEGGTDKIIADAMAEDRGKMAVILFYDKSPRDNVELIHSMAFDLIVDREGAPSRLDNGPRYAKAISQMLAQDQLKPSPTLVLPDGLAGVERGFQYWQEGKVSGQKIVFRIADTPGIDTM